MWKPRGDNPGFAGQALVLFEARDFSPVYAFGTSVFGFAYAVTGKSRAPTDLQSRDNKNPRTLCGAGI